LLRTRLDQASVQSSAAGLQRINAPSVFEELTLNQRAQEVIQCPQPSRYQASLCQTAVDIARSDASASEASEITKHDLPRAFGTKTTSDAAGQANVRSLSARPSGFQPTLQPLMSLSKIPILLLTAYHVDVGCTRQPTPPASQKERVATTSWIEAILVRLGIPALSYFSGSVCCATS
jgi:hypothetical protein